MISEFFKKYPSPESLVDAEETALRVILQPLGLVNKRVKTLKRFSEEFVTKRWDHAKELFGCGKYADDTYEIFIVGNWTGVHPQDHALTDYHTFLLQSY